jgi:Cu2+-exporting ATPase
VVLVRSDPRDVFAILALSRATYAKMAQNLVWATGHNAFAIPLAAGVAYPWGVVLTPAIGAAVMSLSTVIVAINAELLERSHKLVASTSAAVSTRSGEAQNEQPVLPAKTDLRSAPQ